MRSARVILVSVSLSALFALPARADTTEDDLAKYLRLRARLQADFMSVGLEPGQSEPAPERNDAAGFMKWGDGTIALGFYTGVLATEVYLLSHPATFPGADGGDPARLDGTVRELYDALYALERLDLVADASFPPPCTSEPSLNGFFIRDDVPADFFAHFPGITEIRSDYIDPVLTNKEESQDQVYHVQTGLALVVQLVPDDLVVEGRALRPWAKEQAERIARNFADDWVIRNPACNDRRVNRGDDVLGYSFGESLAVAALTEGAFVPTTAPDLEPIWNTLRYPENPVYGNENNLHMALAIMAVGDGFGADTAEVMATLAALQDWPLYPLLHRALHGAAATGFCATFPSVNQRAREMLDELPADGEPACPLPGGPAPHGFTSHNRFIRGASQAYVGSPGCDGLRYHGLDYMLLHNLYAIATPGTWDGSPDADPCASVDGDPDAGPDASVGGDDAGDMPGDAGTPDAGAPAEGASGCACSLATGPGDDPRLALAACLGLALLRAGRPGTRRRGSGEGRPAR